MSLDGRFAAALYEIRAEAERSIAKHGEQGHLPMGTGPYTLPLDVDYAVGGIWPDMTADRIARIATADTKFHSANEGGNDTCTWWLILREEVMEAAAEDDPAKLRAELVQIAAVALKMIDAIDGPVFMCPECTQGKPGNCYGRTLDADDNWVPCAGEACP